MVWTAARHRVKKGWIGDRVQCMAGIKQRQRGEVVLTEKTTGNTRRGGRERGEEEIWFDRAKGLNGVREAAERKKIRNEAESGR